ncbi:hypothetical protein PGT21_005167 [Puccinia graminis f. sp. tritici]|uniref:Uncharacterized protein n=1 Tax=Puccinia graminis f. sp. tritici TaxID=56615 RepID=A0A5B0MZQ9_PUCGR|nr:hypothetical protein PGT21_005167 [Puccinia graminis f. sp. tritici]
MRRQQDSSDHFVFLPSFARFRTNSAACPLNSTPGCSASHRSLQESVFVVVAGIQATLDKRSIRNEIAAGAISTTGSSSNSSINFGLFK